jgi:hypothetical protein
MLNEVVTVPISKMFILVHVKLNEQNCLNHCTLLCTPPLPPRTLMTGTGSAKQISYRTIQYKIISARIGNCISTWTL